MSANDAVDFCDARMRLRAPRVAIVFPADEGWHDWARLALYTASQLWGGKGFVLVPHTGGDVDPIVLRTVVAYDPDYVVQLQVTLGEYEALRPGALSISSAGRVLGGAERAAELARNREEPVPHDAGTAQARATVAAACAPYRQRLLPDRDPSESVEWISSAGAERQFTSVRDLSATEHWPYLAAPPTWGGALGVAVAARCGMVEPPKRGVAAPVEGGEQARLARWLLDPSLHVDLPYDLVRHGGGAATSVRPIDCPPGFDRTTTGLTWITHRAELHPPALVMAGDTAADFGISMIWDRIYGDGYWLPSVLGNDDLPAAAQRLLLTLVQRSRLRGRKVRVVSRSIAAEAVFAIVEALRAPRPATDDRAGASAQYAETVASEPIEYPRGSTGHWAVEHHWDQPLGLPIKRDGGGGTTMLTPPPPPLITTPPLSEVTSLAWQVDLDIAAAPMPPIRTVQSRALLASDEQVGDTWARIGKQGISYESHRFGFVLAGSSPAGQLARPRLRTLGMLEWARSIAREQDRTIQLSDDGRRAEILQRMWGSREALAAALASPMRPVLEAFLVKSRRTDEAYGPNEGIVLSTTGDGYLTFRGMVAAGGGIDEALLRHTVDELTTLGVLVRGLILGCGLCATPSFVRVGYVAQVNTCPRCDTRNELVQPRWTTGDDAEPPWFYDLHPVARTLLKERGHVLLLSHYFRSRSHSYADTAEFTISSSEPRPLAEIDLLAVADGLVIVAEAKHPDGDTATLGTSARTRRRAAAKRSLSAEAMLADQVALATTADAWEEASVNAMRDAITNRRWATSRTPTLRLITNLDSDDPTDKHVRLTRRVQSCPTYLKPNEQK